VLPQLPLSQILSTTNFFFFFCGNDVRWQAYFEQTLATIKPSVGREDLKMYEDYTRMFGMEGTTAGLEEEKEDDDEVIIVSAPGKGKEKLVEMEVDAPPASSTKRRRTGGARSAAPRRPVVAV
jgi:hypothetical protein